jgi:hypothetical protein
MSTAKFPLQPCRHKKRSQQGKSHGEMKTEEAQASSLLQHWVHTSAERDLFNAAFFPCISI